MIEELGAYGFTLTLEIAETNVRPTVTFNRMLFHYDARAFNDGTLPLYSGDWRASTSVGAN